MSEYEQSLVIEAAPETVFDFVSDTKNVPIFVTTALQNETQANDTALPPGDWIRVHPGEYLMEWGSDGERAYSGWLQIEEIGDDASELITHLSFPGYLSVSSESVHQELLAAMHAVKERVEHLPCSLNLRDI